MLENCTHISSLMSVFKWAQRKFQQAHLSVCMKNKQQKRKFFNRFFNLMAFMGWSLFLEHIQRNWIKNNRKMINPGSSLKYLFLDEGIASQRQCVQ